MDQTTDRRNNGSLTPRKGAYNCDHASGASEKTTRMINEAIVLAAEGSKHSQGLGLVGYLTFLADRHPQTFAGLLYKLLSIQPPAKPKEIVYRTVEEISADLRRRGFDKRLLKRMLDAFVD